MKKILTVAAVAFCVGFLCQSARAYEKAITDTTDYIVQNAADAAGQNSVISGNHFPGGTPVAGKKYLVNGGLTTRSPNGSGSYTFVGDSFTLDEGANFVLKGVGSTVTIANLIVYNALISQGDGNSAKTLAGGMTVYGTPTAPSFIQGSGNGGTRRLILNSDISGAAGTRIKVQRTANDGTDSSGAQFYAHFAGDNSGYAGSIEVEGGGNGVCLVGYNNSSFGSSPNIMLSQGGKLFGGGNGGSVSLSGATITLNNGGLLGVYKAGSNNVGLQITGGSTISGSGTLTINNSGFEGSHDRRVALGNVAISGIDGIVVDNGVLQFNSGYSNPTIPITMTQSKMLRTANGISVGPVTLQAGSYMNVAGESVTLSSLTFDKTTDATPYVIKLIRTGCITVTGNIVNNLPAGDKMRLDFNDDSNSLSQFASTNAFRVLSAANLGEAGVTAGDFVATVGSAADFLRDYITNGTFSVESDGNKKYLVYTFNKKFVYSTATDGYSDHSFNTGGHWSDGKAPNSGSDYFVRSGHQIRSVRGASTPFDGNSLSVLSGGKVAVQGGTSGVRDTVDDLRLYSGGILTTTTDWGNNLYGAITVLGSSANPAIYETAWASTSTEKSGRWLTIYAPISGRGSLLCRYQDAAFDVSHPAGLNLRGDNAGFTGEWQIMHPAAKVTFTSADNFGSASALVFNSNGVFRAQGGSFAISAPVVVRNVGSVSGSEELTNGGTIEVDEGQTLAVNGVVSGAGVLRKTGAGTLLLNAENTISGNVVVKAGYVGGTGKVTTLELADGAGFDVSATQATPFEIGTLVVDGGIALNIRDAVNADLGRIAVAKVGALSGTLGDARATVGNRHATYNLSIEGGILYATKKGMVLSIR